MKKEVWRFREPLGRKPRGGWKWKESGAFYDANSLEALYSLIQLGRERDGISCEGLRQQMIDHFCEQDPHLGIKTLIDVTGSPDETAEQKSISWIKHLLTLKLTYIDFSETKKRRKTCKMCPHNNRSAPYKEPYTKEKVFNLTKGYPDDFLGTCDIFNHDNNIATVIEKEEGIILPDDIPEPCWMRGNK